MALFTFWATTHLVARPAPVKLTPLTSGVDASLRGIAVRDAKIVWVSGTGGTVLRSEDGGATWKNVAPPETRDLDFRDIQLLGRETALLMSVGNGPSSRIFKTTDAGMTWSVVHRNHQEAAFFNGLAFWNEKSGLLTSDPIDGKPLLFKTVDGGDSWRRVGKELPALRDGEYGFAASGTLIAVAAPEQVWLVTGGAAARVFRSVDGGIHWEAHETPIRHGESSAGIFSVAFRNPRDGVIVGGDYQKPELADRNVAWTSDGGVKWTLAEADAGMPHKACVQHLGDGRYLAAGRTGLALSDDGGRNWRTLSTESYYAIGYDEASGVGYLAGADGRVARFEAP